MSTNRNQWPGSEVVDFYQADFARDTTDYYQEARAERQGRVAANPTDYHQLNQRRQMPMSDDSSRKQKSPIPAEEKIVDPPEKIPVSPAEKIPVSPVEKILVSPVEKKPAYPNEKSAVATTSTGNQLRGYYEVDEVRSVVPPTAHVSDYPSDYKRVLALDPLKHRAEDFEIPQNFSQFKKDWQKMCTVCTGCFESELDGDLEAVMQRHQNAYFKVGQTILAVQELPPSDQHLLAWQQRSHGSRIEYLGHLIRTQSLGNIVACPTGRSGEADVYSMGPNRSSTLTTDQRRLVASEFSPTSDEPKPSSATIQNVFGVDWLQCYTVQLQPGYNKYYYNYEGGYVPGFTGIVHYLPVWADAARTQLHYCLQSWDPGNGEIKRTRLFRAGEFCAAEPCVTIVYNPAKDKRIHSSASIGATEFKQGFRATPSGKASRGLRHFSYGGRIFVWDFSAKGYGWRMQVLQEVLNDGTEEKTHDNDAEKKGWKWKRKKESRPPDTFDEVLAWRFSDTLSEGTMHFKVGMDQLFREYCLATQLSEVLMRRLITSRSAKPDKTNLYKMGSVTR